MKTSLLSNRISFWRDVLTEGRTKLKDAYFSIPRADLLLTGLATQTDKLLTEMWHEIVNIPDTCLIAVGGYGRGELYPFSDIDLLILLPEKQPIESGPLERFVGSLWDIGLSVGHSIRTMNECIMQAQNDITVLTNLIEARQLTGCPEQFNNFCSELEKSIDRHDFTEKKLDEQRKRHMRFHDTAYNLEPNIKESPGGLRDLHSILWIASGLGLGKTFENLALKGFLLRREVKDIHNQKKTLANLRIRLHYVAGRREDRLLFDYQEILAKQFGFKGNPHRLASEQFMQHYFLTARRISLYNDILLFSITSTIRPQPLSVCMEDSYYQKIGKHLDLIQGTTFSKSPEALLDGFVRLASDSDLEGFTPDTLRSIKQAGTLIDRQFRINRHHQSQFMSILRHSSAAPKILRLMNRYNLLGRYLPAFGRIIGLMQHDLFHVYTVDEHILFVVANLGRFLNQKEESDYPLPYKLMQNFDRPEVLIIAALFHDIAKGRGGDHSKLGEKDVRHFCKQHNLGKGDIELASWLVANHLVMSATSQKQDLTDPATISIFANQVGNEARLNALTLLTIADMQGTSPDIWNAWKGRLLAILYEQTQKYLRGDLTRGSKRILEKQAQARAEMIRSALPQGIELSLWKTFNDDYFLGEEVEDIVWHVRALNRVVNSGKTVVKARVLPNKQGIKVLVYTPNQSALFLKLASTFERLQFNIVEARLHTSKINYVLDSFVVLDEDLATSSYRDLINFIEYELQETIINSSSVTNNLKPRLNRQLRHFPIAPEISIKEKGETDQYTVSLLAGDRPGLLSSIAQVFYKARIEILSARINTLGKRAEDSFHLRTNKLSTKARNDLHHALLAALLTK